MKMMNGNSASPSSSPPSSPPSPLPISLGPGGQNYVCSSSSPSPKKMMNGNYASPSSSPPSTPQSPLPISVGPGGQTYVFSSPSPSPPFSPLPSNHTSAERLPLLQHRSSAPLRVPPSAFSLDRPTPDESDSKSSCLKDLLVWVVLACCKCILSASETQPPDVVNS